jgi:hypothetical protein
MQEEKDGSKNAFDPFESFRGMRDVYLEVLSKTMIEAVNTEAYAELTGTMLDGYLTATAPFREALEKAMVQTLQQLSLPSRQEVAALAQRFTYLEMRLDDMDVKLDRIAKVQGDDRRAKSDEASQAALGEAISKALREHQLVSREDIADLAKSISILQNGLDNLNKVNKPSTVGHVLDSGLVLTAENRANPVAMQLETDKRAPEAQNASAAKRPIRVVPGKKAAAEPERPTRNAKAGDTLR